MMASFQPPVSFMDLPTEVRFQIFRYLAPAIDNPMRGGSFRWPNEDLRKVLLVNKAFNVGLSPLYYSNRVFCFSGLSTVASFLSSVSTNNNLASTRHISVDAAVTTGWCKTRCVTFDALLEKMAERIAGACPNLAYLEVRGVTLWTRRRWKIRSLESVERVFQMFGGRLEVYYAIGTDVVWFIAARTVISCRVGGPD